MKKVFFLAAALLVANAAVAAVISTDSAEMLIPVAGHVEGANGETFVTELTIVNLSRVSETVELVWLPHGGTPNPETETVVLDPLRFIVLEDVVNETFGETGLGALLIRATDGNAALDAHARIWHTRRFGIRSVEMSQAVPAVQLSGWRNGSPAYVHGAHAIWPRYRVNYGIVNLDSRPRQFRVILRSYLGPNEEIVTVPANGTLQRPVPDRAVGYLSIYFEPLEAGGRWHAYASSVSNEGGSGWTVPAMQPRVDVQY